MAIKLEPDDDGVLRFSLDDNLVEIETGVDWRGGFPTADSNPDWRGGHPVFEVHRTLNDAEARVVLDKLHDCDFAPDSEAQGQVVLRGVTRFEPVSLARLAETLDSEFPGARLVIDYDPDTGQ